MSLLIPRLRFALKSNLQTSISQDGVLITLNTAYDVGQYVCGAYFVVAQNSEVTFNAYTVTSESDTFVGLAAMVNPTTPTQQAFDTRDTSGRGPLLTYDSDVGVGGPSTPFTVTLSGGVPKTVFFYRGLDSVQVGGANSGCKAIVQITVVSSNPGPNAIKPNGCGTTKYQVFRSDIDFQLFTQRSIPVGSSEPDWDTLKGYLVRPLFGLGSTVNSAFITPTLTQEEYPADQANLTGKVLLGALSSSSRCEELICRIVRDGLEIRALATLSGQTAFIANGGFGVGYKALWYLAQKWLGEEWSTPSDISYSGQTVKFFHEDGCCYYGADTSAPYPTTGKPLYGTKNSSNYGGSNIFHDNHDIRDPAGLKEPHRYPRLSGTAQGGSASTIQLAAGTGAGIVGNAYEIYTTGGTGAGQVRYLANWNDTTKTGDVRYLSTGGGDDDWGTAPDATTTYDYCNGGTYQEIGSYCMVPHAIAVVMAGETADWGNNSWFDYCKRWITLDGILEPATAYAPYQSTSNARRFGDTTGTWTKKFYDDYALSLWPNFQ